MNSLTNIKIESSETEAQANCREDFIQFFFTHFAIAVKQVEGKFEFGKHIFEWCHRLRWYKKTGTVAPRKHIKTTVLLGYLAWLMYRMDRNYMEWDYMSYKEDLAEYHIKRLRRYIEKMPIFDQYLNLTKAETKIHMAFNGKEFVVNPSGILSFKRGKAPYGIICDDILKDPDSKMNIAVLQKIEKIFKEEVENMPTDELHVWGTPQDDADIFTYLEQKKSYNTKRYPSEVDVHSKTALWPEVWPWERLQGKREDIGDKAFSKEFNCAPVRSEEMFLNRLRIELLTRARLRNYNAEEKPKLKEYTYGGLDIGKKTHPSHLAVFGVRYIWKMKIDDDGKQKLERVPVLRQIHSKWMDAWDYKDQLAYCEKCIENFNMDALFYDNTRGEFEGFKEQGNLPDCMFPLVFTAKNKYSMATQLDTIITNEEIWFLKDERQKRQMLSVDSDLNAFETDEGHGDSFWSVCLAVTAFLKGQGVLVWSLG